MKFTLESIALDLRDEVSAARSEQLGRIVKRFKAAIEEVRRISMALRPSILDDLGIEATIGWFTREFRETYASIKLVQNVQIEEENIGANLKTAMFRILQEALNNVAKHARATEVRVSATETGDEIRLQICDNGIGLLDSKVGDFGHRFGINSMKERAKLSGGILVISSTAKAGTTVEAVWPQRQKNFTPLD
jgi:signal transduction histidine kinase